MIRLLVVDDEAEVLDLLESFFYKKGFPVDKALNGKAAIELIKIHRYGLIFLDYYMPESNGLEVIDYVRKHNFQTNIIIMTGYPAMKESIAKFVGADEYIEKPIDMEVINNILAKYQSIVKPADRSVQPDL
jgi:CheY-like chemotaxis protein